MESSSVSVSAEDHSAAQAAAIVALRAHISQVYEDRDSALRMADELRRRYDPAPVRLARKIYERVQRLPGYSTLRRAINARRIARAERRSQREIERASASQPLITLILSVGDAELVALAPCIASIRAQYYRHWELLLVLDPRLPPSAEKPLRAMVGRDRRVRVLTARGNPHTASSLNQALAAAQGSWIGLLSSNCRLTPDALHAMLEAPPRYPDAVWMYSDDLIFDASESPPRRVCKPAFSPELLLSQFFTEYLSLYSTAVVRTVGGFHDAAATAAHYDLAVRISEVTPAERIVHVPRAVCYRSEHTADGWACFAADGRRVVVQSFARRKVQAVVSVHPAASGLFRIELRPTRFPKVSILIPTRNGSELLKTCIDSIERTTKYPNYEIVVISNQSDEKALFDYVRSKAKQGRVRMIEDNRPFNHSAMNNLAARASDGELLLLANNDIEFTEQGWLEQMVATTELDSKIACVGAQLLYPDRTVQHAGIVLGICGPAGHSHKNLPDGVPGYMNRLQSLQEYSGVTAALMLVRRSAFEEVDGFDELTYPTSFNDPDLCLRLRYRGYRCIYNPLVRATHFESKTRVHNMPVEYSYNRILSNQYWQEMLTDPFYHPELGRFNEQFGGSRDGDAEAWRTSWLRMESLRNNCDHFAGIVWNAPRTSRIQPSFFTQVAWSNSSGSREELHRRLAEQTPRLLEPIERVGRALSRRIPAVARLKPYYHVARIRWAQESPLSFTRWALGRVRNKVLKRLRQAPAPAPLAPMRPATISFDSAANSRELRRAVVYTSSLGNYFFWEIRDLIAAGLRELKLEVTTADEHAGYHPDVDLHVVVAPHEFYHLGAGIGLRDQAPSGKLVMVNTEQASTHFFERARECFAAATAVWDIEYDSSRRVENLGYFCDYLPLGFSEGAEFLKPKPDLPLHYGTKFLEPHILHGLPGDALTDRPIDVLFFGTTTPRRLNFFAKAAGTLAPLRSFLHLADCSRPIIPGKTTTFDTPTMVGLSRRSKLLLNIHRGEDTYFEWHRIVMHGIWQRTLVVTEPCNVAPPFKAGRDFIEAPLDAMPECIAYYLATPQGRIQAERIARQGFETLHKQCVMSAVLANLLRRLRAAHAVPSQKAA